jgi:hypothetical protein
MACLAGVELRGFSARVRDGRARIRPDVSATAVENLRPHTLEAIAVPDDRSACICVDSNAGLKSDTAFAADPPGPRRWEAGSKTARS